MKKFSELLSDRTAVSRILATLVLGLVTISVYLGLQCVGLRNQFSAALIEQQHLVGKREMETEIREQLDQQKDKLKQHEAKIPFVDGYIWLNKFMHSAAPGLKVTVDPPDLSTQDFALLGDYSTGAFHIKGSGSMENFVNLLKTCESELPFAHVRDLQFSFVDENKSRVQFNLVVILVMRLHDAVAEVSTTSTAIASK